LSIWDTVKAFIGISETEEEFNQKLITSIPAEERREEPRNNITYFSVNNNGNKKKPGVANSREMKIIEAVAYEDSREIADYMRAGFPLIVDIKQLDTESARKLIAFLSGTAYALKSHVQKLSGQSFIFTPPDMPISDQKKPTENNVFAGGEKNYAAYQENNRFEESPVELPVRRYSFTS